MALYVLTSTRSSTFLRSAFLVHSYSFVSLKKNFFLNSGIIQQDYVKTVYIDIFLT